MAKKFYFVELSKGEMEGKPYNNVALSNGLRTGVVKNVTGQDDFLKSLVEGDEVIPTFSTEIVKGPNRTSVFATILLKLEKVGAKT